MSVQVSGGISVQVSAETCTGIAPKTCTDTPRNFFFLGWRVQSQAHESTGSSAQNSPTGQGPFNMHDDHEFFQFIETFFRRQAAEKFYQTPVLVKLGPFCPLNFRGLT